jgi:hypothetical protein
MLRAMKETGIRIHAIIASSVVLAQAKNHIERRYTFEKTKDGKTVENWDEILELLANSQASPDETTR